MTGGSGVGFPATIFAGGFTKIEHNTNLFSLEEFREELGYHPFHFWGVAGTNMPVTSSCNDVVKEYAWQGADRSGRREIAKAIQSAEEKLRSYLGYSIAPHFVEELLPFPHYSNPQFVRYGYAGSDAKWIAITAGEGKLIECGVEVLEVIGEANVVYSDTDGDGINDMFTATIATSVLNSDEICAFFVSTDIPSGEDLNKRNEWEILPIKATISGASVTIKGRAWQMVKPILYQGFATEDYLDVSTTSNFASKVQICRRYVSAGSTVSDSQVAFVWETVPYYEGVTDTPSILHAADPNAVAYGTGRAVIRNAETGLLGVGLAYYDTTSGQWIHNMFDATRPPDRIVIRYKAGLEKTHNQINPTFKDVIFRMACAELPGDICACDVANKKLHEWQFDMARTSGVGDEAYTAVSREDLTNPFGTRRGHIYAWKMVKDLGRTTGVAL